MPAEFNLPASTVNYKLQSLTPFVLLGHRLDVQPDAVEFLVRTGYHRTLGARPMRSVVERFLQEAVTGNLLRDRPGSGRVVASEPEGRLTMVD